MQKSELIQKSTVAAAKVLLLQLQHVFQMKGCLSQQIDYLEKNFVHCHQSWNMEVIQHQELIQKGTAAAVAVLLLQLRYFF